MKRLCAFIFAVSLIFVLSSCKKQESDQREIPEEVKEIATQISELVTVKDTSVVENLSENQKEFLEKIGKSETDQKLVAYIDTVNYTLVYSCEFKEGVVTKVTSYHIVKNDKYFNAVSAGIGADSEGTVDKENKTITADKTAEYRGKTYNEMKAEFKNYTMIS